MIKADVHLISVDELGIETSCFNGREMLAQGEWFIAADRVPVQSQRVQTVKFR